MVVGLICSTALSYLFQETLDTPVVRKEIKLTAYNAVSDCIEQISAAHEQIIVPRNPYSGVRIASDAKKSMSPMPAATSSTESPAAAFFHIPNESIF